jgi:hypothetical protein
MHVTGIVLGWIIVTGYLLTVLNYFVKLFNRKVMKDISMDSPLRKRYTGFMKLIMKSHGYIAIYLITFLLLHLLIELVHEGFFITGLVTAGLLILQVILGGYGSLVKNKKRGPWFLAHRAVAALMAVALIIHISTAISLPRD